MLEAAERPVPTPSRKDPCLFWSSDSVAAASPVSAAPERAGGVAPPAAASASRSSPGHAADSDKSALGEPAPPRGPVSLSLFVAALVAADNLCRKLPSNWVATAGLTLLSRQRQRSPWVRWTLARLQDWVEREFGFTFSTETLRKVIRRMGFSWKKARKLLALANSAARKRFIQDLTGLLHRAHNGKLIIVFIDEAHIHLDADLGYGWGIQGQPWFVHSCSPGLQKVSFYGCYLYPLQQVRILPAPKADADRTIEVLERLRADYCELPLWVLWDGASYHRAEAVRARAKELGIELVPLPAYSPDLMPVEALWRWLRQEVTAHHCHQSAAELIDRVSDLEWLVNQDPEALVARLDIRLHLEPEQEKLRFSKLF